MEFDGNAVETTVDESVEEPEVAEPAENPTEESAEEKEVAEPSSETGKTPQDAAFAEMRRRAEKAERELAEHKATQKARQETMQRLTGQEDGDLAAVADSLGMSADELNEALQEGEESALLSMENEQLKSELLQIRVDKAQQEALAAVQKIDPTIQSLEELGQPFLHFLSAKNDDGTPAMSYEEAYFATQSLNNADKLTPPKPPGKAHNEPVEKTRFTREEVEAMSEEEQERNFEKILESSKHW